MPCLPQLVKRQNAFEQKSRGFMAFYLGSGVWYKVRDLAHPHAEVFDHDMSIQNSDAADGTSGRSPLHSVKSGALTGTLTLPGDKSISHRSIMFGATALGETTVTGLLEGEDVLATIAAMRALGAEVTKDDDGVWHVWGVGPGGYKEPDTAIDMGNSGTGVRLLMGLIATSPITVTLIGDASLSSRPMGRVTDPLSEFGARFDGREGGRLPLTMTGANPAQPVTYKLPVASAQVKSAVLLAGLNTAGKTSVIEPIPTRDHTERMLKAFGADIEVAESDEGRVITVTGEKELEACKINVPADPSSAGFPLVAALIVPGSEVCLPGVLLNPGRIGLITTLQEMGADISIENQRDEGGEPVGDIRARYAPLHGVTVPEDRAPSMIDEYPILFVAAAIAKGRTVARGLEELRVKESDRLAVMAEGLKACGVEIEEYQDGIAIAGSDGAAVPGGAEIATHLDHRIAMSFLVLGFVADAPITVDDGAPIRTSFPQFVDDMVRLGATINEGAG